MWKGILYQFLCLWGLTSSPRIFTKALKPVFAHLRGHIGIYWRHWWIIFEKYIDGSPVIHISLGFQVHPKKSMVVPTHKIEYLGFVLSSVDMTVKLTDKKVHATVKRCREFFAWKQGTSHTRSSVPYRTLISTFPGVQFGPLHFRALPFPWTWQEGSFWSGMGVIMKEKWYFPRRV